MKKDEDYATNANNYKDTDESFVGNGFVPLSTTYVTIPRDNQIQLYNPTKDESSEILKLEEGKEGTNIGDATNYIEYDLVINKFKYMLVTKGIPIAKKIRHILKKRK